MTEQEVSTYWDDYETFVINFDAKKWKIEISDSLDEIILHKKGDKK